MAEKTAVIQVTVKTSRKLYMPTVPNFVRSPRADGIDDSIDVGDLSEDQLREIGARWTEALVRKGRERHGDAIARINRELEKQSDA